MKPDYFFQWAVLFEGGLSIVALFIGFLFGLNLWSGAFFDITTVFYILGLTLPLIVCYFVLLWLPFECLKTIDRLICELFQQYMIRFSIWQIAILSVAAGLGEELLFRSLLQSGVYGAIANEATNPMGLEFLTDYRLMFVLIFISILFGAAHAVTTTYFFLAFIISIYLGVILILTGNIIIPISIHALYDFLVLVFIKFRTANK
ncbi:MAG: CPBP family intramembrane metalloprotease [Planctomycetaceae bacterium]|jgi:membrane protease YdiL (CAAX protease family)|nr:CPBP family intramembrane metalloprotease [Planctomycetaceae bacterium]